MADQPMASIVVRSIVGSDGVDATTGAAVTGVSTVGVATIGVVVTVVFHTRAFVARSDGIAICNVAVTMPPTSASFHNASRTAAERIHFVAIQIAVMSSVLC